MARYAAILFTILAGCYLGFIIFGMIQVWPWGLIGIVVLLSFVFLFGWIVKERLGNKEDDHYSKNVDK